MDTTSVSGETGRFQVRGLNIAYHRWGTMGAPTVLFFHGFLDHGRSIEPVARELSDTYQVIAMDARGHGDSDWIGAGGYYHFVDYFHDACVLIEHLRLADNELHLLGHSMGGSIATGVSSILGEKISSVMMLEGMGPPDESDVLPHKRLRDWQKSLARPMNQGSREARRASRRSMPSIEAAADRLQGLNKNIPRERALQFAASFTEEISLENDSPQFFWKFDPLHKTLGARPFLYEYARDLWQNITAPVLSLWGSESVFRPEQVQRRHQCLEEVVVGKIEGAGHNIHHDKPELLVPLIRAWLSGAREIPSMDGVVGTDLSLQPS